MFSSRTQRRTRGPTRASFSIADKQQSNKAAAKKTVGNKIVAKTVVTVGIALSALLALSAAFVKNFGTEALEIQRVKVDASDSTGSSNISKGDEIRVKINANTIRVTGAGKELVLFGPDAKDDLQYTRMSGWAGKGLTIGFDIENGDGELALVNGTEEHSGTQLVLAANAIFDHVFQGKEFTVEVDDCAKIQCKDGRAVDLALLNLFSGKLPFYVSHGYVNTDGLDGYCKDAQALKNLTMKEIFHTQEKLDIAIAHAPDCDKSGSDTFKVCWEKGDRKHPSAGVQKFFEMWEKEIEAWLGKNGRPNTYRIVSSVRGDRTEKTALNKRYGCNPVTEEP